MKDKIFNELYEYAELPEHSELEALKVKYCQWRADQNFSIKTVVSQGYSLSAFVEWCHERGILRPQEVTRESLELYQGHLRRCRKRNGGEYGVEYISGILSTLRGFFKWLSKKRYILYNPASELELPRSVRHLPRNVLSRDEVETIMRSVDLSSRLGLRDRAILETLYSTGVRRFELCDMRSNDVSLDAGVVLVREGKGGRDRVVPIGDRALAWIEKYRGDLRPLLLKKVKIKGEENILFLNIQGKRFHPGRLGTLVRDYVLLSGVGKDKDGACHLFRHAMATHMFEGGADTRYIQQILGHVSLETTQIYTHVSIKMLKEVHTATHPGAKLKREGNR